jgi:hypothetical protein
MFVKGRDFELKDEQQPDIIDHTNKVCGAL